MVMLKKYYQRLLWLDRVRLEGTSAQKRELKVLVRKLKRRKLWLKSWWWGCCFNASDRIKFYKSILDGVNHTVSFKRYIPLRREDLS